MRALAASAAVLVLALGAAVPLVSAQEGEEGSLPVVVWFDDYNEVMVGEAVVLPFPRGASVDVTSRVRKVRCIGPSLVRIAPPGAAPPDNCDGVRGIVELSCSDGRELRGEWWQEGVCWTGHGKGKDEGGNTFHLTYGGSPALVNAVVRESLKSQAAKPALPTAPSGTQMASDLSVGTAFFVTWEGHLLTNHHVVKGARRVEIKLDDGEMLKAEVLRSDEKNDLALLRVKAIREPLALQRETTLTKGEEVFTLGYPLIQLQGQEQKATFGRINALSGLQGDARFTQVDVPIQPGNSGGPLFNRRGEVVGVVTSMLHPGAAFQLAGVVPQNVNYALKSEFAYRLIAKLLDGKAGAGAVAEPREVIDLVAEKQGSVVLVVAR